MMENFDVARKAASTSANSEGSAEKENEKFLQSMEGKITKLKASLEQLSSTAINSDFLKGFIDGGSSAVEIITKLIDQFGILTPLLAGAGIASFVKNLDWGKSSHKLILLLSESIIMKEIA